jgi:hypothetical protein
MTSNGLFVWSAGSGSWSGSEPTETRKPKVPPTTLAMVKSHAGKIDGAKIAPASYMRLAESIGLVSPATEDIKVQMVIAGLGLTILDFSRVDDYLYEQSLKLSDQHKHWVWEPARQADAETLSKTSAPWHLSSTMGYIYNQQYKLPIPADAVQVMSKVKAEMPDAIFMVSNFEVLPKYKPDPFLAVTTPKLLEAEKIYIVYQWDEPGFFNTNMGYPTTGATAQVATKPVGDYLSWMSPMAIGLWFVRV